MKLRDFVEKLLDCDLDLPVVKDNEDGTSSEIVSVVECTDSEGKEIVSIKVK